MATAIVTGANSGIGLETAVGIARAGHRVVLAVRDSAKGATAIDDVRARSGNQDIEQMPLDLASLASVHAFVEAWAARAEPIDILVDNAGVLMRERRTTSDGFEMTFGVNHLGHFLLTNRLLPHLVAAPNGARIVVVASAAHKGARRGLDFDDLMFERRRYGFTGMAAYCASKLANVMFTRTLAKRLADSRVTANSVHPGWVATNFARDGDAGRVGDLAMAMTKPLARTPERGARTSLHAALSPDVEGATGEYFANCAPAAISRWASDESACERLWRVSEELVGLA